LKKENKVRVFVSRQQKKSFTLTLSLKFDLCAKTTSKDFNACTFKMKNRKTNKHVEKKEEELHCEIGQFQFLPFPNIQVRFFV